MPPLPWTGGCRCAAVRFTISAPPLLSMACHCRGCQRMSASAFSLSIAVPSDAFVVTRGETVIGGLHGPQAHHHFCEYCLSWLFTRSEGMDFFVNVRTSMLDDPHALPPFVETCTAEKLPWANTPARHSFEHIPPAEAFEPLIAEYRQSQA